MLNRLSNREKKVMIATEITIPGIAYPAIERFEKTIKNLFFNTLVPKFTKKERRIITVDASKINFIELKFILIISLKSKKLGNVNDQQNIWNKGNKKLKKNMEKQNINAINFLNPLNLIFSFFFFIELTEL